MSAAPPPRLIAFDLDDTLAPSKSPLSPRTAGLLVRLLDRVQVCIISGGRFQQFAEQVIDRMPELAPVAARRLHLMPTCGTQYWRYEEGGWTRLYAEDLTDDEKRRATDAVAERARALGLWETETQGPALEDRGSQITYSALGQLAPVEAKRAWDPTGEKRNGLRAAVQELVPDLEVRAGGSTSIDITRRGIDKAYGMRKLEVATGIPLGEMLFVGDRLDPDGNDYPVVALGVPTKHVEGPDDTASFLEAYLAGGA